MRLANYLNEIKLEVDELSTFELKEKLDGGENIVLIDVRESEEVNEHGLIKGALAISKGVLECKIEGVAPSELDTIVLYCRGGNRSLISAHCLNQMGYENVFSLTGGFNAWKLSGYPTEPL